MSRQFLIFNTSENVVCTIAEFREASKPMEEDCPGWTAGVLDELRTAGSAVLDAGNCCSCVLLKLNTTKRPLDAHPFPNRTRTIT